MSHLAELVCKICGLAHSKAGRPFDESSLAKHMNIVHPDGAALPSVSDALTCDVCGANQSSRGKRFTLPSHVFQHRKKRHPELEHHSSPPVQSSPSVATPQTKTSGRRKQTAALTRASQTSHVKFCPHCGFNLAVVHAALEFINGDLSS